MLASQDLNTFEKDLIGLSKEYQGVDFGTGSACWALARTRLGSVGSLGRVFSGILSPSRFGPQVLPAVLLQLGCNFAGLLGLGQRPVPSLVSTVWPCQFE